MDASKGLAQLQQSFDHVVAMYHSALTTGNNQGAQFLVAEMKRIAENKAITPLPKYLLRGATLHPKRRRSKQKARKVFEHNRRKALQTATAQ